MTQKEKKITLTLGYPDIIMIVRIIGEFQGIADVKDLHAMSERCDLFFDWLNRKIEEQNPMETK